MLSNQFLIRLLLIGRSSAGIAFAFAARAWERAGGGGRGGGNLVPDPLRGCVAGAKLGDEFGAVFCRVHCERAGNDEEGLRKFTNG